jgi:hypothetical protein
MRTNLRSATPALPEVAVALAIFSSIMVLKCVLPPKNDMPPLPASQELARSSTRWRLPSYYCSDGPYYVRSDTVRHCCRVVAQTGQRKDGAADLNMLEHGRRVALNLD